MNRIPVLDIQYFPPIEYFCVIAQSDEVWIETCENFVKQSYRNRCQIMGPNGVQSLVIPIDHQNKHISEVRINYREKWWKEHWRSIETAYNKSPYMLHYKDELKEIYFHKYEKLIDFNQRILTFCLDKLSMVTKIKFTVSYNKSYDSVKFMDLRGVIHPKVDYINRKIYRPVRYFQQFGKTFEPNLSVIDLLMMCGPESKTIVQTSFYKGLNK